MIFWRLVREDGRNVDYTKLCRLKMPLCSFSIHIVKKEYEAEFSEPVVLSESMDIDSLPTHFKDGSPIHELYRQEILDYFSF